MARDLDDVRVGLGDSGGDRADVATGDSAEMVPGLEGEFVNLRESTALMSIKRGASLIEYSTAFAITNGVELRDPPYQAEAA